MKITVELEPGELERAKDWFLTPEDQKLPNADGLAITKIERSLYNQLKDKLYPPEYVSSGMMRL